MPETEKKTSLAMERVAKWNECHSEERWSYEGAIVFGLNDDGTGIALDDPAHAPLVAAAPELLEACQFILKYDGKKIGSVGEGLLRIAIAKATGKEAAHGA